MPEESVVSMRESTSSANRGSGFRTLATISSGLFLVLACMWMFTPAWALAQWGVSSTESAELVGRRAASLYFAFAVMFFMAKDLPSSPGRKALVSGLVVACSILAALGLLELYLGHVRLGILNAVAIEVVMGLALLRADRVPALGNREH
jgi:hypothetical protein